MSTAIMAALNGHLNELATVEKIDVAWENLDFTPSGPDVPYLRAFLLPSVTVAAGLGLQAMNKCRGVFQVDCCYPSGLGWGACMAMADKVRAKFKRGTRIMSSNMVIVSASFGPGSREDNSIRNDGVRYIVPVSISYWAVIAN